MEHEAEFKDVIDCVIAFSRKYECNFNFVKPVLSDAQPKREHRQQAEVEFEDRAQHGDQGEQHHGRRPDRHCGGIDVG